MMMLFKLCMLQSSWPKNPTSNIVAAVPRFATFESLQLLPLYSPIVGRLSCSREPSASRQHSRLSFRSWRANATVKRGISD